MLYGKVGKYAQQYAERDQEKIRKASSYATNTKTEGKDITTKSNDVAIEQRKQQKSQAPIIINAPITNNNIISSNEKPEISEDHSEISGKLTERII